MNARHTFLLLVTAFLLVNCAKPIAKFQVSDTKTQAPATVNFENLSTKADTYLWEFGDGNTSTKESPAHKYVLSGKYNAQLTAKKGNKTSTMTKEIIVEAPHDCLLEMETSMGTLTIQLYDETPKHRDNFIKLAETGFYDELLFHRVIDGFMIQGGDPESKNATPKKRLGSGGPGYQVPAEFDDQYAHVKGALAAARQGDQVNPEKKSSGSQFYIVHGRPVDRDVLEGMEKRKGIEYTEETIAEYEANGGTPFLDGEYTVFGKVVKGMEVIDAIASTKTAQGDRPLKDVKILKVRVIK